MTNIQDILFQYWYLFPLIILVAIIEIYMNKKKKECKIKKKKEFFRKNAENGKEFEKFFGKKFEESGYIVVYHGIEKGKFDQGIDLICNKDNELILIQCKNWKVHNKYKIDHEKLKAFIGSCTEYVNNNKLFHKNIKLKFITSNDILDKSGKKFLGKSKILEYEILEFKK